MKPFMLISTSLCFLILPSFVVPGWYQDTFSDPLGSDGETTTVSSEQTSIVQTEDGGKTIISIEAEETTATSGDGGDYSDGLPSYGSSKEIGGGRSSKEIGGRRRKDQCSILSYIGLTPSQIEEQLNDILNETIAGVMRNLDNRINPMIRQVIDGVREELEIMKKMTSGLKDDTIYEVNELKNETLGLIREVAGDVFQLVENLREEMLQTVESTIKSGSNILDKLKYQVVDIEKSLLEMVVNITDDIRANLLKDGQLLDDISKITTDIGSLIHTTISNIATDENQASMERLLRQLETLIKGESKAHDGSIESRDKEADHQERNVERGKSVASPFGSFDLFNLIESFFNLIASFFNL